MFTKIAAKVPSVWQRFVNGNHSGHREFDANRGNSVIHFAAEN